MFQLAVLQLSHWELTRTPGPVTSIWPFGGDTLHSVQVNPHSGTVYMPQTLPGMWTVNFKIWHLGTSPPLHFVGHKVGERHHMPTIDAHAMTDDSVLISLMMASCLA